MIVRREIGDVLRETRLRKGKTLRDVAGTASVALGYLSEIERGQKEASSEIVASIAEALDEPLSNVYLAVGSRLAVLEGMGQPLVAGTVPDTVPEELVRSFATVSASRR